MPPLLAPIATAALPILVVVLALAGVAKLATAVRRGDPSPGTLSGLGPTALVPERFAKAATILCALGEFGLAAGLMFVNHVAARWPTAIFFAVATFVLWDLRRRRPDVGCGCFGEVSSAPVGLRSIGRTVVLTAMAVVVAVENMTGIDAVTALLADPATAPATAMPAAWLGGGVLLLLVLSPEIDQALARLRHRVPCERRPQPIARAEARLKSSTAWRTHARMLKSDVPTDTWRELCWRFFVFPARNGAEAVFAVYLDGRRADVRVAIVGEDGEPRTSLRESTPVSV